MIEKYVDKTRLQKNTASRAQHAQQQQLPPLARSLVSHPLHFNYRASVFFHVRASRHFCAWNLQALARVAEYFSRAKNTKCFKSRWRCRSALSRSQSGWKLEMSNMSLSLSLLLLALNLTGARQHYALCDVSIGAPCDIQNEKNTRDFQFYQWRMV